MGNFSSIKKSDIMSSGGKWVELKIMHNKPYSEGQVLHTLSQIWTLRGKGVEVKIGS
jgi:hypothetical protein